MNKPALMLDMGQAFESRDGQTFAIYHKDLTGGADAQGKLDARYWGHSLDDPRLQVEYNRHGEALEMWLKACACGAEPPRPFPLAEGMAEGTRYPAPRFLDLERPHGAAKTQRERRRQAAARWRSNPANAQKNRDRARLAMRRRRQQTKTKGA